MAKKWSLAALIGLMAVVLGTSLGLFTIHITNQPYKFDIEYLGIEESSGFSKDEIMENYSYVMEFLSPFENEEFKLPTMKYSETGAKHFQDCKPIFNWIYALGLVSMLGLFVMWRKKLLTKDVLKASSACTLAIPLFVGGFMALDFNTAFIFFHKVFFSGDEWLFDPRTDEIINILPEKFFMHCGIFIALFWVLMAGILFLLSLKKVGDTNEH